MRSMISSKPSPFASLSLCLAAGIAISCVGCASIQRLARLERDRVIVKVVEKEVPIIAEAVVMDVLEREFRRMVLHEVADFAADHWGKGAAGVLLPALLALLRKYQITKKNGKPTEKERK